MYQTVDQETLLRLLEKNLAETDWDALNAALAADPAPAESDIPAPRFSDEDHRARFDAVRRARADLRFDALVWDDAMEQLNQRFIDAQLDLDQYVAAVQALVAGDPNRDRATAEARLTGMRMVELYLRPVGTIQR